MLLLIRLSWKLAHQAARRMVGCFSRGEYCGLVFEVLFFTEEPDPRGSAIREVSRVLGSQFSRHFRRHNTTTNSSREFFQSASSQGCVFPGKICGLTTLERRGTVTTTASITDALTLREYCHISEKSNNNNGGNGKKKARRQRKTLSTPNPVKCEL